MAKKTIVLLGCFDTKGEPYSWLRDRIASKGLGTLLVDISVAGEPTIEPDISASEMETRKNRGLDWIASASASMEGCHRDSVSGEHNRPRSASLPSRPPVFPGLGT
jgi:uncharacterized protein (UPF0261 family)